MWSVTRESFVEAVRNANCISRVVTNLGLPFNTQHTKYVRELIKQLELDTSHFRRKRKHTYVSRECPVCHNIFETPINHRDEKTTCSRKCANTYFRSGPEHPNYKDDAKYNVTCWRFHKKECVICGENLVVAVHHYNGDHDDDRPENMVPLCPTHHQYWHSKHRHVIEERVNTYVENFIRDMGSRRPTTFGS